MDDFARRLQRSLAVRREQSLVGSSARPAPGTLSSTLIQREMSESGPGGLVEPAPGSVPSTSETGSGGAMPSGQAAGGGLTPAPATTGPATTDGGGSVPASVDLGALGLGEFADIAALLDPGLLRDYTADPNRNTAYWLARGIGPLFANIFLCLSRVSPLFIAPTGLFRVIRICYRVVEYGLNDPRTKEALSEAMSTQFPFLREGTILCDCAPPWLIAYFYLYVGLRGEPDAYQHLQHYLEGSGTPIEEPIERLIAEDRGVKQRVERAIKNEDAPRGKLDVAQEAFLNKNWFHALGAIDELRYEVLNDTTSRAANAAAADGTAAVRLWLSDMYEWHPDDSRFYWCLHSSMENMKMWGAKDFWEKGTGVVRLTVPADMIPL